MVAECPRVEGETDAWDMFLRQREEVPHPEVVNAVRDFCDLRCALVRKDGGTRRAFAVRDKLRRVEPHKPLRLAFPEHAVRRIGHAVVDFAAQRVVGKAFQDHSRCEGALGEDEIEFFKPHIV
jgi:hypothetical protein